MSRIEILAILTCGGKIRFDVEAVLTLSKGRENTSNLRSSFPEGHYNPQVSNVSMQWFDNADQSFSLGLKLEDNEIKILHDGLYFVYSQASYRLLCKAESDETEGEVMHMSHKVSRWSDSYSSWKPLLSATRSACKKTTEEYQKYWYGAVYLGAAFNLEAGDRLRTAMDEKLLPKVESAGGKTFFGTFSL